MNSRLVLLLVCIFGIVRYSTSVVPLVYHIYSATDNNGFANSLALNDTYLFVGAPYETESSFTDSGMVYVYERKEATPAWTMMSKLEAVDAKENLNFGFSVSVGTNYSIIGAPSDDIQGTKSGSAYIFTKLAGDWVQQSKLYPLDGSANSNFGFSVSIVNDIAVVGAPGDYRGGAVYIFYRDAANGWYQDTVLYTNITGDNFGYSVALNIDGNRLIVGAPSAGKIGTAFIFELKDGVWSEMNGTIAHPEDSTDSGFGYSVAMYRNTAVIGAPFTAGVDVRGSAYVFEFLEGTWVETVIFPSNSMNGLGTVVALRDDATVFVAAPVSTEIGTVNMYGFNGTMWEWEETFLAAKPFVGDLFGRSIAILGDQIVVGANRINSGAEDVIYSGFFACSSASLSLPSCQAVPTSWNCTEAYYHDYSSCECDCGVPDPDCTLNQCPPAGWSCPLSQWGDGSCECDCHVTDPDCQIENGRMPCERPPTAWSCNSTQWGDGVCDCNCGTYDPHCAQERNGCPTKNWNCTFADFNDEECDCLCGDADPTCPALQCPPQNWTCQYLQWADGKCDCGCGGTDVDCLSVNNTIDCASYIGDEARRRAIVDSVIVFVFILLVLIAILGVLFYRRWQRVKREKYYFKPEMTGEAGKLKTEEFSFGSGASDTASTTEEGRQTLSEKTPLPPPRDYPRRTEEYDESYDENDEYVPPPNDEPPPTSYPLFPPTGDSVTTNLL